MTKSEMPAAPDSPYEVVVLVASCTVIIALSSLIVRFDEKRTQHAASHGDVRAEERLERGWPSASRDNALIGLALLGAPLLGLFAVWFHFFRTRSRSLWLPWQWSGAGLLLGIAAVLLVIVIHGAVVVTLAYLLGLPIDDP